MPDSGSKSSSDYSGYRMKLTGQLLTQQQLDDWLLSLAQEFFRGPRQMWPIIFRVLGYPPISSSMPGAAPWPYSLAAYPAETINYFLRQLTLSDQIERFVL